MSIFSRIKAMFKGKGPSADLMKLADARRVQQNSRVFVDASELVREERERKEKAKESFTFENFVDLLLNSPRRIASAETVSNAIHQLLTDPSAEIPGTHFVDSKKKAKYLQNKANADNAVIRTPEFATASVNGVLANLDVLREFLVSTFSDYTNTNADTKGKKTVELSDYYRDTFIPLLAQRIKDARSNRALDTDFNNALVKANLGRYEKNPETMLTIDDAIKYTPEVVLSTAVHYLARERHFEEIENSILDTVLSLCQSWNNAHKDLTKSFEQIQTSYDKVLDYTATIKNLNEKLAVVRSKRDALALDPEIADFTAGKWDTRAIKLEGDVANQRIQHFLNAIARFASRKAMLTPDGDVNAQKNLVKFQVLDGIEITMDELMTQIFDKEEGHHVLTDEKGEQPPIYLTDTQYHIMTDYYSKLARDIKEGKSDLDKITRGTNLTNLLDALNTEANFDDISFKAKKSLYDYMRTVSSLHAGELKEEPEFNYAVFYMDSMINDYICGYVDAHGKEHPGHLDVIRKYIELQGYKNADSKVLSPMIAKLTNETAKENGIISDNCALYRTAQNTMTNARIGLARNIGQNASKGGEVEIPGKLTNIASLRSTMFKDDAFALRDKIREVIEVPIPEIAKKPIEEERTYFATVKEDGDPVTTLEPKAVENIENAVKEVKDRSNEDLKASEELTDALQEGREMDKFKALVTKYHTTPADFDMQADALRASTLFNGLITTLNQGLFERYNAYIYESSERE